MWKQIDGFSGYMVSRSGRVMGKRKELKPINRSDGYRYVTLYNKRVQKVVNVARLVGIAFVPNPDKKPNIDHINRIRWDNRACNLRWVNQSENLKNPKTVAYRSMMIGDKKAVDVAYENGIPKETFYRRIRRGWNVKNAAFLPVCKESNKLMKNKGV